jgi:hypothetical protein
MLIQGCISGKRNWGLKKSEQQKRKKVNMKKKKKTKYKEATEDKRVN